MIRSQTEKTITMCWRNPEEMELVKRAQEYCKANYDKMDSLVLRALNVYLNLNDVMTWNRGMKK